MTNRKLDKAIQQLFKHIWKLYRGLSKGFVIWLLRIALLPDRRRRRAISGFVLPTTVLLVLVVTLTSSALSYRAFNNSSRVISNVQSKQIYNAATPAIDRARAKLDYLFNGDTRLSSGVPGEEFMISMMLNDGQSIGVSEQRAPISSVVIPGTKAGDPYTLTDETRVDVNGDGKLDNAWIYTETTSGNSVIYAVNMSTPDDATLGANKLLQLKETEKAAGDQTYGGGPYVRSAPLSNNKAVNCPGSGGRNLPEKGWYEDSVDTSILRKRFQVQAFVVKPEDVKAKRANFATLEFSQDRQLDRGNKWGAWFRYDLEIHPGTRMNWNGAMHSDGSVFVANNFNSYLISSPGSCVFLPQTNSEVSVPEIPEQLGTDTNRFRGVIASAWIGGNQTGGFSSPMHKYAGDGYDSGDQLTSDNDWLDSNVTPDQLASDPTLILTDDLRLSRGSDPTNYTNRLATLQGNEFYDNQARFNAKQVKPPYVDDTYRADDRWGPKVQYKGEEKFRIPAGSKIGDPIAGRADMTSNDISTVGDVGLDGYWERRTFANSAPDEKVFTGGMRILVGERLELGNPSGWVAPQDRPNTPTQQNLASPRTPGDGDTDFKDLRKQNYTAATDANDSADLFVSDNEGDPLNPPYQSVEAGYVDPNRFHEAKQRRTLRDNLAAVQASAIYHYRIENGRFPAACLVTTSHPGTVNTLKQSVNFTDLPLATDNFGVDLRFDFFSGKGTNGWEFAMPRAAFDSLAMQQALQNLANFAGDPEGAFPPVQEAGAVHPDPAMTMFGNFSNLRRAVQAAATSRSPADEAYMHTAACTLGALSYNISEIQKFDPAAPANSDLRDALRDLGERMYTLINGRADDGGEVISPPVPFNPQNYDRATPQQYLLALKNLILQEEGLPLTSEIEQAANYRLYRLAQIIHEWYQIRRDRTYGFRPSPAANTWNYNPYMIENDVSFGDPKRVELWSSACDPNIFNVNPAIATGQAGLAVGTTHDPATMRQRLGLSRLCGTVIPPGAIHDYPGDRDYPARGTVPIANKDKYLPVASDPTLLKTEVDRETNDAPAAFTGSTSTLNTDPKYGSSPDTNPVPLYASVLPEFPALYYIFPEFNHDQDGAETTASATVIDTGNIDHRQPGDPPSVSNGLINPTDAVAFQPWSEPYIVESSKINTTAQYLPVSLAQVTNANPIGKYDVLPTTNQTGIASAAGYTVTSFPYKAAATFPTADLSVNLGVTPRLTLDTTWILPNTPSVTVPLPANSDGPPNLIRYGQPGTTSRIGAVPFLDRVMFDGRQWLANRVLDIDLDMLRKTSPAANTDENWLPVSGIVYAFREDARREDAIARPPAGTFTNAQDPTASTDPPLRDDRFNISLKPIDFVPDPDRRDHGFRLRNGRTVKRENSTIPEEKAVRGITFVADNSVYIMGDFNVHRNGSNARLEEFTAKLPNNPNGYNDDTFYDARTKDNRDTSFADPKLDDWRPSEVLADGITILSRTFCDGSVMDTFQTAGEGYQNRDGYQLTDSVKYDDQTKALFAPGCRVNGRQATSFLNQNRPSGQATALPWLGEDLKPVNFSNPSAPVKISRNGNGLIVNTAAPIPVPVEYSSTNDPDRANHNYFKDTDFATDSDRPLQKAFGTTGDNVGDMTNVNAILISGINPSRAFQGYGGMHNFPRLLEYWQGVPLRIAGSFLQLNFSNYATGPYDQERWEPQNGNMTVTNANDLISFFSYAPDRLWGYDVALKLAPASPAATRFTTPGSQENEFYQEPKANDPYMKQLCGVLKAKDPTVSTLNCPT